MSVKEQIVEQLEILPEALLVQLHELIQVFIRTGPSEDTEIYTATSKNQSDPLIGLFAGSPELSTESERILSEEIDPYSGWTWKSNE